MTQDIQNQSPARCRVLILPPADRQHLPIDELLADEHFEMTLVGSIKDALKFLSRQSVDIVILPHEHLADTRLYQAVGRDRLRTAVLCMVSAGESVNLSGPIPIATENLSPERLAEAARDAWERLQLRRQVYSLRQSVAMRFGLDQYVGGSESVRELLQAARRVAPTDITVLLQGPSGCGKQLLAAIIHHHSTRRHQPFVIFDCAALPKGLLRATLFGDQAAGVQSVITTAEGGTLYLRQVEALPAAIQIELAEFVRGMRLPHDAADRRRDIRIMAGARENLLRLVDENRFDRRLGNSLQTVRLDIPPLRARSEDVDLLVDSFLRRLAHERQSSRYQISRPAIDKLRQYSWPGNVRELEDCLGRAVAICQNGTIDIADITLVDQGGRLQPVGAEDYARTAASGGSLDEGQREIILRALNENEWNYTRTAQELGIGRTTLWRKVKKYRLSPETVEAASN